MRSYRYSNRRAVDGGDNNNAFFGQARRRYRAPYREGAADGRVIQPAEPGQQAGPVPQDGFISNSARFVQTTNTTGINIFPAQYRVPCTFLRATEA
jgi:hypothetical protein